jgi:hypothetical protein
MSKTMGVWPVRGSQEVGKRIGDFLERFQQAGGQMDHLVLDFEESYSCWGMDEQRLSAIAADPRAPALIEKLGFKDLTNALFTKSPNGEFVVWEAVAARIVSDAIDDALFHPLRRHFPSAGMSNFAAVAVSKHDTIPDIAGHPQYFIGDPIGSHQAPCLYGGATPANIKADWTRPFMQVLYSTNLVRCASRSSAHPIIPWFCFKSLRLNANCPTIWGETPYWDEAVFHAMLSAGTNNVFFFNPPNKSAVTTQPAHGALERDNETMESVMAEVERAARGSPIVAALAVEPVNWTASSVISAARLADGSTLVRVTFSEHAAEAEFKLGGKEMKVERHPGRTGAWVRMESDHKQH